MFFLWMINLFPLETTQMKSRFTPIGRLLYASKVRKKGALATPIHTSTVLEPSTHAEQRRRIAGEAKIGDGASEEHQRQEGILPHIRPRTDSGGDK